MDENRTPRQMVKDLLQGISPPRPLFLPIVFSLGAKMENLPLREFLRNPTKISNSLRQIRGYLRADGVCCYFDPHLEAEALGAVLDTESETPVVQWPQGARRGQLPAGLGSPEEAARSSRVQVAAEVIRRLNSLLRDGSLLTVGTTGPFTLAASLLQLNSKPSPARTQFSDEALEIASCVLTSISSVFLEAGANLIFIREEILPSLAAEDFDRWRSLLAPAINVIRFYGALPVLLLTDTRASAEIAEGMLRESWDCVVCFPPDVISPHLPPSKSAFNGIGPGIALPTRTNPDHDNSVMQEVRLILSSLRATVVTTASDISPATDLKRLVRMFEEIRACPGQNAGASCHE